MNIGEFTVFQKKKLTQSQNNNISKFIATRGIIRNKFKKAYANRRNHEHSVIEAMKPMTQSTAARLSKKKTSPPLSTIAIKPICKTSPLQTSSGANDLCIQLQKLLNSPIKNDVNCSQEIKTIITKLRELEIIV